MTDVANDKQPENKPTKKPANPEFLYSRDEWNRMVRRFFLTFLLVFGGLALASWGYNLYGLSLESRAEENLASGNLMEVLDTLDGGHLFGMYEPWHDFGTDRDAANYEEVRKVVGSGLDYTSTQRDLLRHQIAFYMTAFREFKNGDVPIVESDKVVMESLLERYSNALHSGIVFSIYLTLVTLIFGVLYFVLVRRKAIERI